MEDAAANPRAGFHLEALTGAGLRLASMRVMRTPLQAFVLSGVLLVTGSAAHAQVTVDVHIGPPPPPRAYRVPPPPSPEYVWVEGYQYPQGSHYRWHDGYWTRPPYLGAYWVAPYYRGGRYYAGRWEGDRGHVGHDHHWDRDKERDEHRDHHKDRDHDRR